MDQKNWQCWQSHRVLSSYGNSDIENAARCWTGLSKRPARDNIFRFDLVSANDIDPMKIKPEFRDKYPKTKLGGGYLGDGYQLCSELPPQQFLKTGARYVLDGGISILGEWYDNLAAYGIWVNDL